MYYVEFSMNVYLQSVTFLVPSFMRLILMSFEMPSDTFVSLVSFVLLSHMRVTLVSIVIFLAT